MIKLFEEFNINTYWEMPKSEWTNGGDEIEMTQFELDKAREYFDFKSEGGYFLTFTIFTDIHDQKNGIFITLLSILICKEYDDWYIIKMEVTWGKKTRNGNYSPHDEALIYFKCDQLDGLLDCLGYIKKHFQYD